MADFPFHQRLWLKNITVFEDATFTFTPGINAFVGENGTGKTHVLKALYAIQFVCSRGRSPEETMSGVFQSKDLGLLIHDAAPREAVAEMGGRWDENWQFVLQRSQENPPYTLTMSGIYPNMPRPVFIPAIDMMGHTRRFVATFDEYEIDFDQTHRDIVSLLLSPEQRRPDENNGLSEMLGSTLGGSIEEDNERFYLRTPQGRQPMPLVAEGLRKIATLQQLLRNGWLRPGSVLFWDEPEVNLNPVLMDEVIGALLKLAATGVQVFLATHSYVILKELDLQSEAIGAEVGYFAFERTENGTIVHRADSYAALHPNPISEQFDRLYDLELSRATSAGRPR